MADAFPKALMKSGIAPLRAAFACGCIPLLLLLASHAAGQTREIPPPKSTAAGKEQPAITVVLPNVGNAYQDLKMLFDMAGDPKGYDTFKETVGVFLVGVESEKPLGLRIFSTPDGLRSVGTLPVRNESDFNRFLENLFDLDIKTAPVPRRAQAVQVPRNVRDKVKSLNLRSGERIIFGLYDGFLKYEAGHVQIGQTLDGVRNVTGSIPVPAESMKGESLTIHFEGRAQSPEQRRQAFDTTRTELLDSLARFENESDDQFAHRKSITDQAARDIGDLFAEASEARIHWITSRERKTARVHAELAADPESRLAGRIERIGKSPDVFAGVGKEECVAWGSINLPLDDRRRHSIKTVSEHARAGAKTALRNNARTDTARSTYTDLTDLMADVTDDVAGMSEFNAFFRTWSNGGGTLTTVGGVKVSDVTKVLEYLQKLKGKRREGEEVRLKMASIGGVDIHQVALAQRYSDAPELFDREGAIYVGTGDKTVWYGLGEKALERLKQAIQEAKPGGTSPNTAAELHARLLPLAEAWDRSRSRRGELPESIQNAAKRKANDARAKAARTVSTLHDLQLSRLAVEAFRKGNDSFSVQLESKGKGLELTEELDQGILRFVGMALSRFTKENLSD